MTTPLLISSLVVALASPAASSSQSPPSMACSLLTAAEIEVATGSKPDAEAHPAQFTPPGASEPMQMCTWAVRPLKGQVVLSAAHLPPGMDEAAVAKNNAGMDALRAAKWKEESKDFGGAWCSIMTPPDSAKAPLTNDRRPSPRRISESGLTPSPTARGQIFWGLYSTFTLANARLTFSEWPPLTALAVLALSVFRGRSLIDLAVFDFPVFFLFIPPPLPVCQPFSELSIYSGGISTPRCIPTAFRSP